MQLLKLFPVLLLAIQTQSKPCKWNSDRLLCNCVIWQTLTLGPSLETEWVQVFTRSWVGTAGADPRGTTSMGVRYMLEYFYGCQVHVRILLWGKCEMPLTWGSSFGPPDWLGDTLAWEMGILVLVAVDVLAVHCTAVPVLQNWFESCEEIKQRTYYFQCVSFINVGRRKRSPLFFSSNQVPWWTNLLDW